ncbi:SMS protein [Salipaludibacillus keqinensis]|uniref:GTP cyclohydrolase 1 type 2 homolog n=1 Tax=Salipaludibacillus keqinensis TaxID=2045207 RepID=A0A323TL87_9BACI|nr:Nif3-like dinuclear metal center hexameric protein [Salipaludibacillus keqinensis]PYZ94704.1 SMS protein [Salipaludibacillus keqinensis]
MEFKQFEQTITQLFGKQLLSEFDDEYGFNNKTNHKITTIGYATNLSIEVIEMAAESDVDLIITHHDAWDFIYGLKEKCLEKLERYGIRHFWIHSPLDYIEFGTSTSLMNVLGVDHIETYSMFKNGRESPGIGKFDSRLPFHELVHRIKKELSEPIRAWRNSHKDVEKVGVLTGAGHSSDHIKYALEEGCDTYITGEATLYTIQYAQFAGVNLLVGSHTFTEIYGVESLVKRVQEKNRDIRTIQLVEDHFELGHL